LAHDWKPGDWAIFAGAISPACGPAHGRAGRDGGTLVQIIDINNPDPDDPSLAGHSIFARSSSSGGVGAVHPDELELPPWMSGDGGGLRTEAPIETTA
jgi:hypothetical protein